MKIITPSAQTPSAHIPVHTHKISRNALSRLTIWRVLNSEMARSAIGTRSVTGRAAAAAEQLKEEANTSNSTLTMVTDGTRPQKKTLKLATGKDGIAMGKDAEEDESELSSVPSDLSDNEDNRTTAPRYFGASSSTRVPATTLGKRQSFSIAESEVEMAEAVDRELTKRVKTASGLRQGISSFTSSKHFYTQGTQLGSAFFSTTTGGAFSPAHRRPAGVSDNAVGSSSRKRVAKEEPNVDEVEAEVEELTIKDEGEDDMEVKKEIPGERKGKRPAARGSKKIKKVSSMNPVPPPPNWEEMYDLVREMRLQVSAPVDTMGCERLAEEVGGRITPEISRFHTLVALMLSSQTKDTVTAVAIRKLQTLLPGGLSIPSILSTSPETLDSLIHPVGFHNRKTQYLLQTAQILKDKYNSDIPRSIEDLCSLPGVGPKMAHLCMSAAWDETMGIGVDVHVHRITNMWGWTGKKGTDTPEQTRVALESWLPRDRWREINHMLVGFGQTICLSRGPKCSECKLAEKGLCRAARVPQAGGRRVHVKREVKREFKEEELEGGDRGMKMERERDGQAVKMELIPQFPLSTGSGYSGGNTAVPRVRRVRREVKFEDDAEGGGFIKREIESETHMREAGNDPGNKWKLEKESQEFEIKKESEENMDMEDIFGRSLSRLPSAGFNRGRRRG